MAPRYALSSSEPESEAESASGRPADDVLEKALRDAVTKVYNSGKMEELTVKRVRLAAEKALQLEEGFYKTQGDWKTRSEQIIKDQVEEEEKVTQEPVPDDEEVAASSASEDAKPAKRARPAKPSTSRKRQKRSASESDDGDATNGSPVEEEDKVEKVPKKQTKATPKKQPSPKTSEDYVQDFDEEEGAKPEKAEETPKDDSESELSVVLDEEPKPKPNRKRQKSAEAPLRKGRKHTTAKGKDADIDPNQAEIKRLQGWLLKCGIRKMWARELAPYDTPKAKINHLKGMLKEAGMEGRYSVEKANRIREERELKADLEMVQEGAKRWGKGSGSENSDDSRPKRRLNRGRKSLAFLESEGEETD
ncbi:hypothetical protein AtubIFM56815_001867 [Aspergillus tubingensis]|uniref:Uncharacterized protein n=1 Tax=Aspergillus tubingensis TaxID=5068 RepID=A0A8H3Y2M7_ASPTU|nr:transcriptional regulator [Aspergillus tubingensis]GFN19732.1 transcriptional regulator [Aspergillus tubingensis]GLA87441.1 hypothetical protein AtubIFM56815_001867 [Aspergillus tubingensis]